MSDSSKPPKYVKSIEDLKVGCERYEKVRKLSSKQFEELLKRNVKTGEPFDSLVDGLE